jgi:tRNA (cytidine/uridine-2'-O-)-methyltransferase
VFHVVLHQPQIPPNTGNIIRLCANTGCALHLVRPIGFALDAKTVRRAGLDYVEVATVRVHASFADCVEELGVMRMFAVETGGSISYSDAQFRPGDALVFGSEHRGLPGRVLEQIPRARQLSIPMRPGSRSLNLSNAVSVVVYEAWRQAGFAARAGR